MRPIVLTIAGSDPSAGAGVQADLKAIEASGGYAATVLTAITVQNTHGVTRVEALSGDLVGEQLRSVLDDLPVAAIKTGMLGSVAVLREVAAVLREAPPRQLVCDPVLSTAGGVELLDPEALSALRSELFPLVSLLTPNVPEATALSGVEIRDLDQAERAARRILDDGPEAVLIKGGHLEAAPGVDLLCTRDGSRRFAGQWIGNRETHGTGCVYASAIATGLARGMSVELAVASAKRCIQAAIAGGVRPGSGAFVAEPLASIADSIVDSGGRP